MTLIDDLKRDEGWVPHVYEDHLGYWTLGYGFMIDKRRGGEIPDAVAEYWLCYIVNRNWEQLIQRFPWLYDQPEPVQRAVQNMAYQLGVTGVANFRRMMAALRRGDREAAAFEALDSNWAKQTPERAQRVAALIRGC